MKKRLLFLQYILRENKDSMLYKVFIALNEEKVTLLILLRRTKLI